MPGLDVSDVLDDPDFADTFSVVRVVQSVSSGGVASTTTTQTFASVSGVVQPDGGQSLLRMPDGSRLKDSIKVYTRFALTTGSGPTDADKVTWNGQNYVVVSVLDWSRYGAGFIMASCDLTDINP